MTRRVGFTILELLVVIAVIAMLAALLLPSVNRAREQARQVTCMSNMQQITAAYINYAKDFNDQFLPPDSTIAQAGLANSSNQSQIIPALFHYARSPGIYHCPEDERQGALSYSINDYLGGTWPAFQRPYARLTEVRNSSQVLALIEEINLHPKVLNNNGGFVIQPSPSIVWIDFPAISHRKGTCLSFVDGHCERWQWSDPRTFLLASGPSFPNTPNNPDLQQLQSILGGK
jgi:prepilin-type N-terminal cleavage/methylation domain-containing protein